MFSCFFIVELFCTVIICILLLHVSGTYTCYCAQVVQLRSTNGQQAVTNVYRVHITAVLLAELQLSVDVIMATTARHMINQVPLAQVGISHVPLDN